MEKARELGLTLTELIILLLKEKPVPDKKDREQLYHHLSNLTREMNMIGRNINQVTIAIHQINNSDKMEMGEFNVLKSLLQAYTLKQEELRDCINKAIF